jgi:hypothetical protein
MSGAGGKTCKNCTHFEAIEGECRKGSPTAFFAGVDAEGKPLIIGAFPPVRSHQWCGKFQLEADEGRPQ